MMPKSYDSLVSERVKAQNPFFFLDLIVVLNPLEDIVKVFHFIRWFVIVINQPIMVILMKKCATSTSGREFNRTTLQLCVQEKT